MSNTIKIKRRTQGAPGPPDSLANGELAYNEVNNVLYYGASEGIRTIGGQGVFVTALSSEINPLGFQEVYGNKTFVAPVVFTGGLLPSGVLSIESNDDSIPNTQWVRQIVDLELNDPIVDAGVF